MSTPEPELAATHLFNEIANLEPGEVDRAKTLYFQIRRLRQQQPADFTISVCLAVAALKVGRRDEAIDELMRAYGLKRISEIVEWGALADMFMFVGRLDRSAELYGKLRAVPGAFAIPQVCRNGANAAFMLGDIEFLQFIAEENAKVARDSGLAGFYLSIINNYGISRTFQKHQQIVSAVLQDFQIWLTPEICLAYQDEPSVMITHWCLGDRKECSKLQDAIIDALRAYYQSVGVPLAPALSALLHRVVEAPKMNVPMALAS